MAFPTAPVELIRQQLPLPAYVDNVVLAGAAKTITVPTGASWVWISVSDTCYLRVGTAAIVPTADTGSGGGAPALGEGSFPLKVGDTGLLFPTAGVLAFSIIGTAVVSLAWYRDHTSPITQ